MTDQDRHDLAERFTNDWLEPHDDDPADLANGHPRLACDRVMITMALVGLIEGVELETREDRSGGDVIDLDRLVSLCILGDHTT